MWKIESKTEHPSSILCYSIAFRLLGLQIHVQYSTAVDNLGDVFVRQKLAETMLVVVSETQGKYIFKKSKQVVAVSTLHMIIFEAFQWGFLLEWWCF